MRFGALPYAVLCLTFGCEGVAESRQKQPTFEPSSGDGATASGPMGDAAAQAGLADARTESQAPTDGSSEDPAKGSEPDAGFATDRDSFFGVPRCAAHDFLLCEDFEADDAPSPARWEKRVSNNGTSLRVDDLHAARGQKALHLTVASGFSQAFLRETETFPAASRGLWGRAFFFVESPLPSTFNHWTLAEAVGIEDGNTQVQVRYGGILNPGASAHHFLFNYEKQPRPDGFNELGLDDQDAEGGRERQIDSDTWHCVEFQFDVVGSEARFFWDGVEREAVHAAGMVDGTALQFPAFSALNIGWTLYQALDRSYEVWIDEVAVDTKRIGCQR